MIPQYAFFVQVWIYIGHIDCKSTSSDILIPMTFLDNHSNNYSHHKVIIEFCSKASALYFWIIRPDDFMAFRRLDDHFGMSKLFL